MLPRPAVAVLALLAGALVPRPLPAAELARSGPLRVLVGGEGSASLAAEDHGYFNHQEYYQNVLRLVRFRLSTELRAGERVALLGEARRTNTDPVRIYALYLRVRPLATVPLDLQAGQVPPVFGAYPRRSYAADNPLIGEPLGYQYLTSLRTDAVPATLDDLLSMRGRGWRVQYPLGSSYWAPGLAPVSALRWDTGLQARYASDAIEAALSLTQGSPCNPRREDDNDGKALSARLAWRSASGFAGGLSAARGRYLEGALETRIGRGPRRQEALGADLEYTRGRWRLRAEGFRVSWDLPVGDAAVPDTDLGAWTAMAEVRVKLLPGWSAAARADRLDFGTVTGSAGRTPWEYDVTRYEAGLAFTPHRYAVFKASFQHNRRAGGTVRDQSFLAGQVLLWF